LFVIKIILTTFGLIHFITHLFRIIFHKFINCNIIEFLQLFYQTLKYKIIFHLFAITVQKFKLPDFLFSSHLRNHHPIVIVIDL
jgi:hypothetical protein